MSIASERTTPTPAVERATFTLDHYEHLVACGAFEGEYKERVELLWGEIVKMSPIGPPHCDDVDKIAKWSFDATRGHPIRVRIQQPIRLPASDSEPEPDVVWVREQSYAERHPNPDEALLVIEVAETSLGADRGPKLAAYAQAGVADYWIVNLGDRRVEVYRRPEGQAYRERADLKPGETASPLALPEASLKVSELFPAKS